jgi:hypothetical protein
MQKSNTMFMKALSIKQPWAYLIIEGIKDIENRKWTPSSIFRGKIYIHAPINFDKIAYNNLKLSYNLPDVDKFELGGIIGESELVDVVNYSDSIWFEGPYGFVLKNSRKLPFKECKGKLGFFECGINYEK